MDLLLNKYWNTNLCDPSAGPSITHSRIFVFEAEAVVIHRINRHAETVQDVVENDDAPFFLLIFGEAILCIDQSHLFQDC